MGDSISVLPPGCRFYPSEHQLLCYYLANKNCNLNADGGHLYGFDVIRELNLYDYGPFELPENVRYVYGYGGRRRHWYCYTARATKESVRRMAKGGYWRRKSRVRDVVGMGGKMVVGRKTRFVFYLGNSVKSAVRTDWVMDEDVLCDHLDTSFVLCRVFIKSCGANNLSEHDLSYCAEDTVSVVRHLGIQHNGIITSDTLKTEVCDGFSVERKNEISRHLRLFNEIDDCQVQTGPVSVASFQLHTSTQPNDRRSSVHTGSNEMLVDGMTAQQLQSIIEEDFIELDDLVNPDLNTDYGR